MAKWGEGDPRWIVEERPDATNVNNWHWTEKNACQWSIDKFHQLFNNFQIQDGIAKCKITEVEKCEGEAVANNRKGKLIFFYEWVLKLKWKGKLEGGENKVTGTLEIPNLSEENDVSEIVVNVSVSESNPESDKLKEFMYRKGSDAIREQLGKYIVSLKEEFAQGMILPKKEDITRSDVTLVSSNFDKVCVNGAPADLKKNENKGCKLLLSNVDFTEKFQCMGEELYNALTVPELVQAFTMGPAKVDAKEGGQFEILNGTIHGTFTELIPGKKIVQQWRIKHWPQGVYSTVTFNISQKDDHTELRVTQKGVPSSEVESLKENWNKYYWLALKRTFGFGSIISDF